MSNRDNFGKYTSIDELLVEILNRIETSKLYLRRIAANQEQLVKLYDRENQTWVKALTDSQAILNRMGDLKERSRTHRINGTSNPYEEEHDRLQNELYTYGPWRRAMEERTPIRDEIVDLMGRMRNERVHVDLGCKYVKKAIEYTQA